jgi:Zinc finger, C2H2 type
MDAYSYSWLELSYAYYLLNQSFLMRTQPEVENSRTIPKKTCKKAKNKQVQHLKSSNGFHDKERKRQIFKCEKCPRKFNTKKELKQHDTFHSKPLLCHYCGDRFANQRYLFRHLHNKHNAV